MGERAAVAGGDFVLDSARKQLVMFTQLGVFPDDRRRMLAKRDQVRSMAGI